MKTPETEELEALQRLLIYARLEAERLELWPIWDQLKLTEGLLENRLADPVVYRTQTGSCH